MAHERKPVHRVGVGYIVTIFRAAGPNAVQNILCWWKVRRSLNIYWNDVSHQRVLIVRTLAIASKGSKTHCTLSTVSLLYVHNFMQII
jgi:hypothetical protein